jgi:branched-chain amino acid transport system permease protein
VRNIDTRKFVIWGFVGLVIVTLPLWISSYYLHLAVMSLIFILLAASLNMIGGYAGFMSLAHAAFWGIGAYAAANVALRMGNVWLAFVAAFVVAGIVGLLLGIPSLRLQGIYLTMITIAFGVVASLLFVNLDWLTGGPVGIGNIPRPSLFGVTLVERWQYYYLSLAVVGGSIGFMAWFFRSATGRSIIAARDDELAAACSGVDTVRNKIIVFALSSAFAGLAGALFAHYVQYINTDSFTVANSIRILIMVVVGGLGSLMGSVVGALVIYLLPEFLRFLDVVYLVVYALLVIVMMLFLPDGLVSLPAKLSDLLRKRRKASVGADSSATVVAVEELRRRDGGA